MIKQYLCNIVLLLCALLAFNSCQTYRTFYGETATLKTVTQESYRLDMSGRNLQEVPSVIQTLQALRMINLSGNPNLNIAEVLERLPRPEMLEVLLLDNLGLTQMPALDRFVNLKQLSLSYNPALEAENIFAQAQKTPLEFLNLKGNGWAELPVSITKMEHLRDLNLSENNLKDSQSYMHLAALPSLYSLWLDNNQLDVWPEGLSELRQVNYLFLNDNKLEALPNSIEQMENLWVLHLGHNRLSELPASLMEMPSLLAVHLNNNKITSFPRSYGEGSYSLMALLLDQNPIPQTERAWAEQAFKHFFLLSFEQRY